MTAAASAPELVTVGEASARTGFSIDTLRYYEKRGLLVGVDRTAGGRRLYSADDLGWLGLVACLRGTGLPLAEMHQFAELVRAGEDNHAERQALLVAHRERVLAHLAEVKEKLELIDYKIDYYGESQGDR